MTMSSMGCVLSAALSLDLNGSLHNDDTAAGGRPTDYLDLAKKGGGHKGNSFSLQ